MSAFEIINSYTSEKDKDLTTVLDCLNNANHASTAERNDILYKMQDFLLCKARPLYELLPDILRLTVEKSPEVKKWLVGFIEEICKKHENLIPKIVNSLHMLLCDESVLVQKNVIRAMSSIYKNMMLWLTRAYVTEEIEEAWDVLNRIKAEIVNMVDSDNDGVRTHSIKFLESTVLLQTYPEPGNCRKENDFSLEDLPLTLKIARRRKLEEEANHIFSLLVKFHGSPHISSVNLMACMGSICTIAKQRPEFMPKVVGALENLLSNLPPTLSHSQVSSVRKHMRFQLLQLIKQPSAADHRGPITTMLTDLGCSQQEIGRLIPRAEDKRRIPKRNCEATPVVAKKPRLVQELEQKMEENERQKQLIEMTQFYILEQLNLNTVIQIVFKHIHNVPSVMPETFASDYNKVFSGSLVTLNDLAKVLAPLFVESGVTGTGFVEPKPVPEPEVVVPKNSEVEKPETVNKETKVNRTVRPRVKILKLPEVTRPLSSDIREQMLIGAVDRILRADTSSLKTSVAHTRYKIITSLASSFTPTVREAVLKYLLSDLRSHVDLALAWLYEEYSLMQGFRRAQTLVKREEKTEESYNTLLCSLISNLQDGDVKDREGLLARIYLEAPLLTSEALSLLKQMCKEADKCVTALNLMHDLVVRRPPRGHLYLCALLYHSTYDDATVREEAVARVISLYERPEWQNTIEKYAMEYLEMLQANSPPSSLFGSECGRPVKSETWTDDLIRVCLCLYLALLPYNESLIHALSRVYTQTGAETKRTILRVLEQPIRGMGMDSPELLLLVERCPKGAETLVTRIIQILSDRGPPSAQLVSRVRDLYQSRVSDVRFLIPVLNGLTKKEVTAALPKLIKLNPVVVKEVFNRLLGLHGDSPISPSELLIALHLIDPTKAELKAVIKATSLCFAEKQIYTQEVLAVVMQQLMEVNPLPTLLMRTVIQSITLYPRLTGFIMNILQRLILKQVWRQKVAWEGFIKCCLRTTPQSFQVLLQLPPPQLAEGLTMCPELRQPLMDHVQSFTDTQRAHVPASTMDVIMGISQPPLISTIIAEENGDARDSSTEEPLPPGMD